MSKAIIYSLIIFISSIALIAVNYNILWCCYDTSFDRPGGGFRLADQTMNQRWRLVWSEEFNNGQNSSASGECPKSLVSNGGYVIEDSPRRTNSAPVRCNGVTIQNGFLRIITTPDRGGVEVFRMAYKPNVIFLPTRPLRVEIRLRPPTTRQVYCQILIVNAIRYVLNQTVPVLVPFVSGIYKPEDLRKTWQWEQSVYDARALGPTDYEAHLLASSVNASDEQPMPSLRHLAVGDFNVFAFEWDNFYNGLTQFYLNDRKTFSFQQTKATNLLPDEELTLFLNVYHLTDYKAANGTLRPGYRSSKESTNHWLAFNSQSLLTDKFSVEIDYIRVYHAK